MVVILRNIALSIPEMVNLAHQNVMVKVVEPKVAASAIL